MTTYRDELKLLLGAEDKASPTLAKITKSVVGIGAAYMSWQVAKDLIGDIIKQGMEAEQVWNDVAASLKRHGLAVGDNLNIVKDFAKQMQNTTGISDEVIGTSIQKLVDYGNDLKTSFNLVKTASDLAAGGHVDMMSAIDLVGKASVGYTATLARYGIIIDDSIPKSEKFAAAIEQINQRFGGAAAARMETTAGQLALLTEKFGDLQESIGAVALGPLSDGMRGLITIFNTLGGVIDDTIPKINASTLSLKDQADLLKKIQESHSQISKVLKSSGVDWEAWTNQVTGLGIMVKNALDLIFDPLGMLLTVVKEGKLDFETLSKIGQTFSKDANELYDGLLLSKKGFDSLSGATQEAETALVSYSDKLTYFEKRAQKNILDKKAEISAEQYVPSEPFGPMPLDDFATFQEGVIEINRETNDIIAKDDNDAFDAHIVAYEDHLDKTAALAEQNAQSIANSLGNAAAGIIDILNGMEVDTRAMWIRMQKDFVKFFIKAALTKTKMDFATEFISILSNFFDSPINDEKARQQGRHYVKYFTEGATSQLRKSNLAGKLSGSISISDIENEISVGRSRILMGNGSITGGPDVFFN